MTHHHLDDADAAPLPPDDVTAARAQRLSALLDMALADDIATRNSAARMRPAVLNAALVADTRAQRRRMLRAAVLVVVVGSVVAVPSARAWVADQVRALGQLIAGDAALPAPSLPAPVPVVSEDADVRYAFDVSGPVLTVRLDAPAGSVEVVQAAAGTDRATAEALAAPGTEVLVQPGGVVITSNRATATSRFVISVPAGVDMVRLRHGGAVVELRPGSGWRVP